MITDAEHFFIHLVLYVFFWDLLGPLLIFQWGYYNCVWILVLLLSCLSFLLILDLSHLGDIWFAIIFFHSVGGLLILLTVPFAVQKLLSLVWFQVNLCFYCLFLRSNPKIHGQDGGHWYFPLYLLVVVLQL